MPELDSIRIPRWLGLQVTTCHFWTDSSVVLAWLENPSSKLKTFVANRVAAIQHKSIDKGFKWPWVSGEDNPADCASRGVMPHDLKNHSFWWTGPEWLLSGEDSWPDHPTDGCIEETMLSEVKIVALTTIDPLQRGSWFRARKPTPISTFLQSYSCFRKMKRVMAYILRAINCFKHKAEPKMFKHCGPLSADELDKATIVLIKMDQAFSFKKELNDITNDDVSSKDGTMWLEETTGILRLRGRVLSDNLDFDEQYPILLSPKDI